MISCQVENNRPVENTKVTVSAKELKRSQRLLNPKPPTFDTGGGINGYDGIPFSIPASEVQPYLSKIEDHPKLYRVPTKSYYAYDLVRKGENNRSQVTVYFKDGKLNMFKDVLDGPWVRDNESAQATYRQLALEYRSKWGNPDYESPRRISWIRNDISAHLTIDLPDNPYGLPIVKILVWKDETTE